ncbi:MAG TPA: preprotein translocase subunit SecG [Fibrobacteria bacterium]|nr:preprotein translocase subunit SecG [Fibrobacteria bacterium]
MNHWLFVALVVLHIFVCILLVLLILVQNDKGGGLAGAFGGMGGSAAFTGSSTATFLTKLTQGVALASFVLLLALNYMSTKGIESGRRESELKSARKGLSSVIPSGQLPANGGSEGPVKSIPGLGTAPGGQESGAGEAVPAAPEPVKGQ